MKEFIQTPLGEMTAITSASALLLLAFVEDKTLMRKINYLDQRQVAVNPELMARVRNELERYFDGTLREFTVPLDMHGTVFQKLAWQGLLQIPYGSTMSYVAQARFIGKSQSFRAVANANAANPISIIVPCHRVINAGGKLCGYAAHPKRKKWLINHELQMSCNAATEI